MLARFPRRLRTGHDPHDLFDAFGLNRADVLADREVDLVVGLADAAEQDLVRRDPATEREKELSAADDVGAATGRRERLHDAAGAVRLHRVTDAMRSGLESVA